MIFLTGDNDSSDGDEGQFFVLLIDKSEQEAQDIIADIIRSSGRSAECRGIEISFVMDGVGVKHGITTTLKGR